jgi:hypothetical protein
MPASRAVHAPRHDGAGIPARIDRIRAPDALVLGLQRTVGNQQVARLLAARPPTLRSGVAPGSLLQRALSQAQQDDLKQRALALETRLQGIVNRIPAPMSSAGARQAAWRGTDHPALERIRAVFQDARDRHAALDFDPVNASLNEQLAAVDALDAYVTRHAAVLTGIERIYAAFTAGGVVRAELGGVQERRDKLAVNFLRQTAAPTDMNNFLRALQKAVIPDNKAMQAIRARNAQEAMDTLARLIDAGLVAVDAHKAFYESPFDLAEDHFGASWGLKGTAASGALQWLREWEFHVHAHATPPHPAATASFAITRAHVKPSADAHALGVSIQITDANLLAGVVNATRDKFLRWAASSRGQEILRGKKRAA